MNDPSRRIAVNVVITLLTQLATWGLSFLVTLYLPRYIKDTGLGALTLAAAFSGFLSVLVGLGTSIVLIREGALNKERLSRLIIASLTIRLPLGVGALSIGWIAAQVLHYSVFIETILLLSVVAMVIGQLTDVFTCALRSLEDFPRQNAISLLEKVLASAATIVLIAAHGPLLAIAAVGIVTGMVSLGFSIVSIGKHISLSELVRDLRIDPQQVRFLLAAGLPFLASAVFTAVYGQCDAILLSKMSSVAAIGWYGLGNRLGGTMMVIPVTLCATMLPLMVRVFKEDGDRFASIVHRLMSLMIVSVIPFAAVLVLAPGRILSIMHYPMSFQHSIPVLIVSGTGIIFWFLSQSIGTTLIACDRQSVFAKVTGVAALVSVPQCALFIWLTERWFANGAAGAAASDVLLEAGMVAAYICCLPPGLITVRLLTVFVRASIAAVPLVLLFETSQDRLAPYLMCLGVLLYILLCIIFRCINPKDVNILRSLLRRSSRV